MNEYVAKVLRELNDEQYSEILEIRKQHYYNNPYNSNYWKGGIQILLDEESIKRSHENDIHSRFILITNEYNAVVAYARYSINYTKYKNFSLSKIHVLASKKEILGEVVIIITGRNKKLNTLGKFMMSEIIRESTLSGSDLIISEISVFPYPNLPSLVLHNSLGFLSISNNLISRLRTGSFVKNQFIILGKPLTHSKDNQYHNIFNNYTF